MTIDEDRTSDAALTSRRAVLLGAGAIAGAGLLAACGTDTPAPPTAPGGAPAPGPATAPADASIPTSDIPVGGGTIYADRNTVVTQPTAGTFKAFGATCKHGGCTVGRVADGVIICPCHGSRYRIADGAVVQGPATSGLDARTVTVSGDHLTVT